jgi:hypothetical protein
VPYYHLRFRGFASPYSGCGRALFTGSGPALFTGSGSAWFASFGVLRGKGLRGVCLHNMTYLEREIFKVEEKKKHCPVSDSGNRHAVALSFGAPFMS